MFSNVGVLIYVFDIESREFERDLVTYAAIVRTLAAHSPAAAVFCLIHKMDLVQDHFRARIFAERAALVRERTRAAVASLGIAASASTHPTPSPMNGRDAEAAAAAAAAAAGHDDGARAGAGAGAGMGMGIGSPGAAGAVACFATSIWDQSLYKAWSSIIHTLVPNLAALEAHLRRLADSLAAEEIVLFERTTFLVVTHVTSALGARNPCRDRFERLSNIVKTWKQSLAKHTGLPRAAPQFVEFGLKTSKFALFVAQFTPNTYILVVTAPGEATYNCAVINTKLAVQHFERMDGLGKADGGGGGSGGSGSGSGGGSGGGGGGKRG